MVENILTLSELAEQYYDVILNLDKSLSMEQSKGWAVFQTDHSDILLTVALHPDTVNRISPSLFPDQMKLIKLLTIGHDDLKNGFRRDAIRILLQNKELNTLYSSY